ncbi:hypothetical protein Cs7R123_05800 [Catellatospora sp. TT07R-123]|uniref:YncE family protein n=1 Tax=Catellatospora sp. TT07R-123 TaxID=2733863 RepID=UPI001B2091F5|nr:YncE family protein [Catellatospora sp. TT07R-123]GHJ43238.1 hypothetical protein Cs7R123_05800 [Catellatospora sp. TT07R-123]
MALAAVFLIVVGVIGVLRRPRTPMRPELILACLTGVAAIELGADPVVSRVTGIAVILASLTVAAAVLWGEYVVRRLPSDADPGRVQLVRVGRNPQAVQLDPAGTTAYVPCAWGRGTLAMVDVARGSARLAPVGRGAVTALPLPQSGLALVSIFRPWRGGRLVIVDTAAGKVTGMVSGPRAPRGLAASPDGHLVYVTSMWDHSLWILDARTLQPTATIGGVGRVPVAVASSPDGGKLFVAAAAGEAVTVVDAVRREVVGSIPLEAIPRSLAVNAAGDTLFVTCRDGGLHIIDTELGRKRQVITVGAGLGDVAAHPSDPERFYLTDTHHGKVFQFAAAKRPDRMFELRRTVPVPPDGPLGIAVGPDGLVHVACNQGTLETLDFTR